jgi:hypothetical protein
MSAPLPPWLQIEPSQYLKAMESGSQAGLERNRLALSAQESLQRNQLAQSEQQQQEREAAARMALAKQQQQQQAEQFSAGISLQRDRLLAEASQKQEQQSAVMALKEAQMQQQAMLAANSLDAKKQRNDDLATYQQGLLQNKNDLLDLKEKTAKPTNDGYVTIFDDAGKPEAKLPAPRYADYLDAKKAWAANAPPKTIPGKMWGENDNPAYAAYVAKNPPPTPIDFLRPATAPTPAASEQPAAATLTASSNMPPNPLADSQSPRGNYSAPEFQSGKADKVATPDIIRKALSDAKGNKESARQWLEDNGYTIPQSQ